MGENNVISHFDVKAPLLKSSHRFAIRKQHHQLFGHIMRLFTCHAYIIVITCYLEPAGYIITRGAGGLVFTLQLLELIELTVHSTNTVNKIEG